MCTWKQIILVFSSTHDCFHIHDVFGLVMSAAMWHAFCIHAAWHNQVTWPVHDHFHPLFDQLHGYITENAYIAENSFGLHCHKTTHMTIKHLHTWQATWPNELACTWRHTWPLYMTINRTYLILLIVTSTMMLEMTIIAWPNVHSRMRSSSITSHCARLHFYFICVWVPVKYCLFGVKTSFYAWVTD